MLKWNKCFSCLFNGECQNQNVEHPCGQILEDIYTKNNREIECLRDKVKLAEALFELIDLSKKKPEINMEDIIDIALAVFGKYNKECVDNEKSNF